MRSRICCRFVPPPDTQTTSFSIVDALFTGDDLADHM
jgi:hypothetical protein